MTPNDGPAYRPTRRCQTCKHWQASDAVHPSDRQHYRLCVKRAVPTMGYDGCNSHATIYAKGAQR